MQTDGNGCQTGTEAIHSQAFSTDYDDCHFGRFVLCAWITPIELIVIEDYRDYAAERLHDVRWNRLEGG